MALVLPRRLLRSLPFVYAPIHVHGRIVRAGSVVTITGWQRRRDPLRTTKSAACTRLLATGLGLVLSAATANAQTKIITGVVAHSATLLPNYWASDFGCAKENGYAIDFVSVGGGGAQQLAVGALQISQSGFPDYFRAIAQRAPMKIFINNNSNPPYSVHAKPAIKKIADLKGKTVSIGGVKDVTLIYMQPFLASAGLKTSDVDFVYARSARRSPAMTPPRAGET
jgi:ABC-type nitrate/sulfonate/bicarbonate transport system substrate-binding protein